MSDIFTLDSSETNKAMHFYPAPIQMHKISPFIQEGYVLFGISSNWNPADACSLQDNLYDNFVIGDSKNHWWEDHDMKKKVTKVLFGATVVMAVLLVPAISCFAEPGPTFVETPEPLSVLLLGAGIAGLVGLKKFLR